MFINISEKGNWSGNKNWEKVAYFVEAGRRTFTWTYSKDNSEFRGDDSAYIGDIEFPVP